MAMVNPVSGATAAAVTSEERAEEKRRQRERAARSEEGKRLASEAEDLGKRLASIDLAEADQQ